MVQLTHSLAAMMEYFKGDESIKKNLEIIHDKFVEISKETSILKQVSVKIFILKQNYL